MCVRPGKVACFSGCKSRLSACTINVVSGWTGLANFGEHMWSILYIEWDTITAEPVYVIALRTGFPDLWNALRGY